MWNTFILFRKERRYRIIHSSKMNRRIKWTWKISSRERKEVSEKLFSLSLSGHIRFLFPSLQFYSAYRVLVSMNDFLPNDKTDSIWSSSYTGLFQSLSASKVWSGIQTLSFRLICLVTSIRPVNFDNSVTIRLFAWQSMIHLSVKLGQKSIRPMERWERQS